MQRAARVLYDHDVPDADVLEASLASLQQHRDAILSYRSFVQMDDFHSHNIIVDSSQVRGFIDLEMTRYGNEVLLLAAAVVLTLDKPALWASLRKGHEDHCGRPIDPQTMTLARVAAPFSQWIRFMWYWTTDPKFLEEGEATRGWPIRDIKARILKLQKPES
jgi:Ser/Thr protein kinase RdoA (MazF antagonist)